MDSKREILRLSAEQTNLLMNWLIKEYQVSPKTRDTPAVYRPLDRKPRAMAELASFGLGFQVTRCNVATYAKNLGIGRYQKPKKTKPNRTYDSITSLRARVIRQDGELRGLIQALTNRMSRAEAALRDMQADNVVFVGNPEDGG